MTRIVSWLINALIVFIVMFDKDGVQLGMTLAPTTSDSVVLFASILGNVLWIYGLLMLFLTLILCVLLFNEEPRLEAYNKLKAKNSRELKGIKPYTIFALTISGMVSLFAIGSGFWFSGTAILSAVIVLPLYYSALHKMWKEDPDNIGTDTSKNPLLED